MQSLAVRPQNRCRWGSRSIMKG